jgi:hypothetical protein
VAQHVPAAPQSWDQHVEVESADTRLPSWRAIGPGVLALGQSRYDPYLSPLVEDVVRAPAGCDPDGDFVMHRARGTGGSRGLVSTP